MLKVKAEVDKANTADLLQAVKNDAASTKEDIDSYRQHSSEKLQEDLRVGEVLISKLKEELEKMKQNVDITKEELNCYRHRNEKLQEELDVREHSIAQLKEELQEVQRVLEKTVESGTPSISPSPSPSPQSLSSASSSSTTQPKRKGNKQAAGKGSSAKDKPSLSRKTSSQSSNKSHGTQPNSSSKQQHVAVMHAFTQTEHPQISDLGPESKSHANSEVEEIIGEFQEKIVQMQELHAAEILDMEARHISESEGLRRDTQVLEDECKALKAVIDKLRTTEVRPGNTNCAQHPYNIEFPYIY